MSEINETLAPEQQQIQLISIYKALPNRAVSGTRMGDAIGVENLKPMHPELAEHVEEQATLSGIHYSNTAELPVMKKQLLEKLLSGANITEVSKTYITTLFGGSFAIGLDDEMKIFEIIGVTDDSRMEAGIFSKNLETRKQIERGIAKEIEGELNSIKADYPNGDEDDLINEHQAILDRFGEEFHALYGQELFSNL